MVEGGDVGLEAVLDLVDLLSDGVDLLLDLDESVDEDQEGVVDEGVDLVDQVVDVRELLLEDVLDELDHLEGEADERGDGGLEVLGEHGELVACGLREDVEDAVVVGVAEDLLSELSGYADQALVGQHVADVQDDAAGEVQLEGLEVSGGAFLVLFRCEV